jgi:hypothetical protein
VELTTAVAECSRSVEHNRAGRARTLLRSSRRKRVSPALSLCWKQPAHGNSWRGFDLCRTRYPRAGRPEECRRLPTFLHGQMYPGFKFIDVKISIDTPDQAFDEYTIHQMSGISGKPLPAK